MERSWVVPPLVTDRRCRKDRPRFGRSPSRDHQRTRRISRGNALRHFLHFSQSAARAAGLRPQQHQALLAIKGYPDRDEVTVGELADRLRYTTTAWSSSSIGWRDWDLSAA